MAGIWALASMGLMVMVSAESSQSISASLAASFSWMKCWWAIRTRYMPMATRNTSMHTEMMMTTVAMLGITVVREKSIGHGKQRAMDPSASGSVLWRYPFISPPKAVEKTCCFPSIMGASLELGPVGLQQGKSQVSRENSSKIT